MATSVALQNPAAPGKREPRRRQGGRWRRLTGGWSFSRILVVVVITAGVAVFSYPEVANWITDLNHDQVLTSYAEKMNQLPSEEREKLLDAAHTYNENLPNGPLRDPFAVDENGKPIEIGSGRKVYQDTLNLAGDGIMGTISIPKIKVSLPIYHGTGEHSLDNGVGHLYGSGLPVGGEGTHSVLTAHSGVVGSKLFTDVNTLELGDTFTIQVAGETLTYKIDDIRKVLPDQLQSLRQVAGKDYVTLVTCTPIGVNTHRLLVRGVRVPNVATGETDTNAFHGAGFPWWGLPTPLSALLLIFGTRPLAPLLTASGAAAGAPARIRIALTFRSTNSKELEEWKRQHRRVVRYTPPQEHSTGRLRATDASVTLVTWPGAEGVYTWGLYEGEHCIGISVFAYPNEVLARQDATWAMRLRTLRGLRPARWSRRAYWLVGLHGVPLMMPGTRRSMTRGEALHAGEEAAKLLSQAKLEWTGFGGHPDDENPWFMREPVKKRNDDRGEHTSL